MERRLGRLSLGLLLAAGCMAQSATQPRTLTWQQTEQEFKLNNPELLAGQVTIDESRADEITAYLRPNPDFTLSTDGTQITPHDGIWRPFPALSYLRASAICTSANTNASCAWPARKEQLRLPSPLKRTWSEI